MLRAGAPSGGAFAAAWEFVKGLTGRAWDWIKGAICDAMSWIGQKISEGFHHDIDVIANMGPMFLAAAQGLGHQMVEGITRGLVNLAGAVADKFGQLWGLIRGLAGAAAFAAASIGRAITQGILSGLAGLAGSIAHEVAGAVSAGLSHIPVPHIGIPHFAAGVQNFAGGLAIVGERGPELLSLPGGSSVSPMRATAGRGALAVAGGGNLTVNVRVDGALLGSSVPEVADTIYRELLRRQNRNTNLGLT